jgi:hypothetical protein
VRINSLSPGGIAFNASHLIRQMHGDTIPVRLTHLMLPKACCGSFFTAAFQKKECPGPKAARRYCVVLAAQSCCNGMIGRIQSKKVAAQGKFFEGSILDYRSPFWNGEGARPEKIGRRSSTALHVWSGQADASSSDVP